MHFPEPSAPLIPPAAETVLTFLQSVGRRSEAEVKKAIDDCREQCWMVCTVSPPMRRRPLKPVTWIAGAKLFGLDTRVRQ